MYKYTINTNTLIEQNPTTVVSLCVLGKFELALRQKTHI